MGAVGFGPREAKSNAGGVVGFGAPTRSRDATQLQTRVTTLEQRAQQLGGGFETLEERPGIFATLIDVLSRPNFAVAGAVDEILNNNTSIAGAGGRALRELFSGVGSLQGEKEDFGRVLKDAGMGTVTLSEVAPFLEGTWVGNFGTRGALGLALDIGFDPLTYVTLGTGNAARAVATKAGVFKLNKPGRELLKQRGDDALAAARNANPNLTGREQLEILDKVSERFSKFIVDDDGKFLKGAGLGEDLIQPGAIRFAGANLVEYGTIRKAARDYVGEPMVKVLERAGVADAVLPRVKSFGEGTKSTFIKIFHPFGDLGNAPKPVRERAMRIMRKAGGAHAGLRGILQDRVNEIDEMVAAIAKTEDEAIEIGKEIYTKVEAREMDKLRPELLPIAQTARKLVSELLVEGKGKGIIGDIDAAFAEIFLPHSYLNAKEEWLEVLNKAKGESIMLGEVNSVNHALQRHYTSFAEAVEISETMERITTRLRERKINVSIPPKLKPNYNLARNLQTYVDWYADATMRKAISEDLLSAFGIKIDNFNAGLNDYFDLGQRDRLARHAGERAKIDEFWGRAEGLRSAAAREGAKKPTGRPVPLDDLFDDAELTLRQLSDDGKREFMRELFTRIQSPSQFASVIQKMQNQGGEFFAKLAKKLGSPDGSDFHDWSSFFPRARSIAPGFTDTEWSFYGAKGAYTVRSGGVYGDAPVAVPKIVADQIDRMPGSVIKDKEMKRLLAGYDWINNTFKTFNYAIWPASAVRDFYNNIAQSFLDVGIGALDPKTNTIAAKVSWAMRSKGVGDGIVEIPEIGLRMTARELRELSEELGVSQKGSVLAQVFGDVDPKTGQFFSKRRKLKKTKDKIRKGALNFRADVFENQTRNTLWIQHMRRGMSPRDAADRVRQALFDYTEASPAMRATILRVVPFGQFIVKNTEFQARMLATQPGRVINQVKPFRQDKEDTDFMTKWEAEALAIRLNRDGKTITTLTGIDLPLRSLDNLWAGSPQQTMRRLLGTMSPVIKAPIEGATGTNLFTGSQYPRTTSNSVGRAIERMPRGVRDWMGYKKETDDAGRVNYSFNAVRYNLVFRSWLLSRMVATSDRTFREYVDGDPNMQGLFLDFATGIRFKEIDLDEQQEKKLRSRIRSLERALIQRQGRISTEPREGIQESF